MLVLIMMQLAAALALLFSVSAGASQEWHLLWVTHDVNWEAHKAHGLLKQTGNVLEGVLVADDDARPDYRLRIELNNESAAGMFEVISENDGASKLKGTYKRWPHSSKHCPEQIQLINEYEYLGLARNVCKL